MSDKAQERAAQAQCDLRNWAQSFVAMRHWLRLNEETAAKVADDLYRELRSAYIKGAADGAADVADAFRKSRG